MSQQKITYNCTELSNVIIVEDSKTFTSVLTRAVKSDLKIDADIFSSFSDVKRHLESSCNNYFAALLDLNLPDAPNGEIVDLVVSKGIPSVVFTADISDELRDRMWSKRIVDYVLKDNPENIQQVVGLLKRLHQNLGKKILVADDSMTNRRFLKSLLEVWNYTVLEARDGQEAMDILKKETGIVMLITDYNMPNKDGIALVKEARQILSKSRLPIIGISGVGGATTSAHFIKAGANDYIHKPFLVEELYCRLLHNIENSEYIATIRNLAERDYMTGIYNRRSFFTYGSKLFASHKRGDIKITVAMLDIDYFKRCNDTYGHESGDDVIKYVAQTLDQRLRESDLVARIGGEEFCMICVNLDAKKMYAFYDGIRKFIEDSVIHSCGQDIRVTVSTGVCAKTAGSLEEMMKIADEMLYESKEDGRNRVTISRD